MTELRIKTTAAAAALFSLDDELMWPGSRIDIVCDRTTGPIALNPSYYWWPESREQLERALADAIDRQENGWSCNNPGAAKQCARAFERACRKALDGS